MTTSAKLIRSERYAEIGAIVQRDAPVLVDRWARRAVEEQPTARRVHHAVLLNHMSSFLWELGAHLAATGESDGAPHRRSAVQHGEQRWETDWSLTELIRDYRIMRLVVLEHLDDCLDRPLRLLEIQAAGLAIDDAIEASVECYVRSREAQLRQSHEALREADRRKNEFLAVLAHELRNPLAPLRNSLEVVRLSNDSPEAFRRAREIMDRQVEQLTRLVEDLLDVTRIAQGKLVLKMELLDLGTSVAQAVQMNAPLRESRGHHLTVTLPPEPVWVEADPARVVQVLVNLLNNACKYTPDGGSLSIAAAPEGNVAVIRVMDSGIGIPAEKLASVFDLYAQLDFGSDGGRGGLGIGLTLVRRLVELHGGTVSATSAGEGMGSEFEVRLPAASERRKNDSTSAGGSMARGRHVLIVEDDNDGRESLAVLLDLLGHRVSVATDGQNGLDVALELRPEVALIDIGLPGLDGYEVARRLRAVLGDEVLLIALTGYCQPEDQRRAIEAGFNSHLVKPVDLPTLEKSLSAERPSAR